MSTLSLTHRQSVFERCHSDRRFSEFLPARWRQKSTGIDMEQNYVTVAPCIPMPLFTLSGSVIIIIIIVVVIFDPR